MPAAGILGIGVHLPPTVRRNDFWPAATVARWREKAQRAAPPAHLTDGMRRSLTASLDYADDPFNGARERRVMGDDVVSSDMETSAAAAALVDAGVAAEQIGALLVFSFCPDWLFVQNGAAVHRKLGLPQRCFTLTVDAACNSFLLQLTMAQQMIESGMVSHVLLVQSAAFSRVVPAESPMSPWLGDGATAVVVGPVGPGRGVLGHVHGVDGSKQKAVVGGVPGKRWYDEGRIIAYSEDPTLSRDMILQAADRAAQAIPTLLSEQGVRADEVDFYASHQGTPWLRRVTQEVAGLSRARSFDTYPFLASMTACNIPLVLDCARRERLLREGDLVAMFSGGTGETWSSLLLRWGMA